MSVGGMEWELGINGDGKTDDFGSCTGIGMLGLKNTLIYMDDALTFSNNYDFVMCFSVVQLLI